MTASSCWQRVLKSTSGQFFHNIIHAYVISPRWPLVENSRQGLDISRPRLPSLWVRKSRSAIVHAFCHRIELVFCSSRTGVMSNLGKNIPVARARVDFLDTSKVRCRSTSFPLSMYQGRYLDTASGVLFSQACPVLTWGFLGLKTLTIFP